MENNFEDIKLKIMELSETTPNINSISYGFKFVNGQQTNELSIMYGVEKKKPLSELTPDEVFPSTIDVNGKTIKTDVHEVGSMQLLACNPYCGQIAGPNSAANRAYTRPLKGGLSITSTNTISTVGTLGFIAVHTETQALVGVTNNHVLIQDSFYTSDRDLSGIIQNEYNPPNIVYQDGESGVIPPSNFRVGQSVRYVPLSRNGRNFVDAAMFSLESEDVDINTSYQTVGFSYTQPLPFATSSEINNLLITNPMLYASGRTTGPKGGAGCPMRIFSLFSTTVLTYKLQGVPTYCYFLDQLTFVKPENDPSLSILCAKPVWFGDSGSALIADFNGVRKIIGLVFAGGPAGGEFYYGYANRIDHVASDLGIEAWDGTAKNYIDPGSIIYKTTINGSSNKTLSCEGKIYWQVGLTTLSSPC